MAFEPGEKIGDYEIVAKLGAGGLRYGLLMVLASKVTEPEMASALPASVVSVWSVMEA